jgi:hypothetical protein
MVPLRTTAPRILDFDCENAPLSYLGGDFTTPSITALAWHWVGRREVEVRLLPGDSVDAIVEDFAVRYAAADIVTGHNIRKHDLPLINAMLLELGHTPLHPKLVCDTYADLKRRSPGFASQATLSAMLGVKSPKIGMSTVDWREANRFTPEGVEKTRRRVVGDVKQHVALRARLLELGWLRAPRLWTP